MPVPCQSSNCHTVMYFRHPLRASCFSAVVLFFSMNVSCAVIVQCVSGKFFTILDFIGYGLFQTIRQW